MVKIFWLDVNMKQKIIGLTGIYCAGKNHAAALLEQRGLPALDVDKLGHKVLEAEKEAVFARFGGDLKKPDGTVDRRLLGKRIFGQAGETAALEAIVHPAANRMTEEWIAGQNTSCVINAALLHKSSAFSRLDFIILVHAPLLTRLLRARRRDRLSLLDLLRRFASQKNFIPQYLAGKADIYRVENPGFLKRPDLGSRRFSEGLEHRIDEILTTEGIR
jgi:dephospho-CoA kinase